MWKTMMSSRRLRNSGLKSPLGLLHDFFLHRFVVGSAGPDRAKPQSVCRLMSSAPTFEVMMMIVLRKSTLRPSESVSRAVLEDLQQEVA